MSETSNKSFNPAENPRLMHVFTHDHETGTSSEPEQPLVTTLTTGEHAIQKGNKVRNRIIAIGSGALATAVITTGLFLLPKSERGGGTTDAPAKAEGTSQAASPKPEKTPKQETTTAPEVVNGFEFSGKPLEQMHTVEQMDALTVDEFAQLPYADRLAYAIGKNPNIRVDTPDNPYFADEPGFVVAEWQDIDGSSIGTGDANEGAKIISANQYYTTVKGSSELSNSYKASSDSALENSTEGTMISTTTVYVDRGDWQTGTDRDGNQIDFVNVTSYSADASTGERITEDSTDQVIRQEVKLLNGKTVIAYPRGYGVEGKVSPIEGGTY